MSNLLDYPLIVPSTMDGMMAMRLFLIERGPFCTETGVPGGYYWNSNEFGKGTRE
jgi:hypothetical protein